jgi:hypothetical protein
MLMSSENKNSIDPSSIESTGQSIIDNSSDIQKGTILTYVKDINLACCLITLGIKLRSDPPIIHFRRPDGTDDITFSFMDSSPDGEFVTKDMITAYRNDTKFIQQNPEHPMSYMIAVVKNIASVKNSLARSIPYLAFKANKNSGVTIYVQEGTKKHQNCVAKGMVHVDTREIPAK